MKQPQLKTMVALLATSTSLLLSGCGGGSNTTNSGQSVQGAPIQAQVSNKIFNNNSCLSGNVNFSGSSVWYVSGNVNITNNCDNDTTLTGQTISFNAQDLAGHSVSIGTLNNWWINDSAYQLNFTSGNANQQIGLVSASNNSPVIKAHQTISFTGGLNLNGSAFDNTSAQNSFAINGNAPAPITTGELDVVVDTTKANCLASNACSNLVVNVNDNTGTNVASFTVPASAIGGVYTQPITKLNQGSYSVNGSAINNTTLTYTPNANPQVTANTTSSVTLQYNQVTPVITTGKAELSLANLVPNYTGNLQVQILNSQEANSVVSTYTIKQGTSITTSDLPVSDAKHAYKVKLMTGIADPAQNLYYIESGLADLTINAGQTTNLNIPLQKSTQATQTVNLSVSGLVNPDNAQVIFSDAANKYSYAPSTNLTNSSLVYKVEQNLNLGISVTANSNNYQVNPIESSAIINQSTNFVANFVKKDNPTPPTPSGASYDYIAPFKDYNNKITLTVQGLASGKSLTFTSNFQQKAGWGNCFGQQVSNLTFTTVAQGNKYLTTITSNDSSKSLDLTQSCDIMGTDSANALVLPGVVDPIVYGVTVDNKSLTMNQPCASNQCQDPGNGYVNAGYYAQWSVWGRQYNPYTMPFNNINDIIYAFIGFDAATGNIKSLDTSADSWGLSAVSRAMLQYPYMHAHLSFGGWTNNGINTAPMFEQLASSTTSMTNFANQAVSLMRKTGFTGLDIDWEWWSDYPNNAAPATKMLSFYKILRNALDQAGQTDGKHYTLTIAVNGGADRVLALQGKNVDGSNNGNPNAVANFWSQVNGLVDHINMMNYDYHGAYDTGGAAYFQANYDFQNTTGYKVGQTEGWSIKDAISTYTANGVVANKLVVGLPLYARTMTVSSATNGGLLQNVTGAGFGDYENGVLDYKCLVNPVVDPVNGCGSSKPISGVTSLTNYNNTTNSTLFNQYGLQALQPWAYSSATNSFVTYDNVWSAVQKTKVAKNSGLGGMMYWELDGDATTPALSIVQAVKNELN
ncbi:MAG: hypothetical protein RLZZ293_968, partial [Pseudomonadota bacterium]